MDRPFVAKDGVKRSPDGTRAHYPWPARMHTHDVVFICPACHEFFNIRRLERFVKRRLNFVWRADEVGVWQESFGHG